MISREEMEDISMCDPKRSRTKLPTGGCHHVGIQSWSRRVGYNLTANVKWKNGLASQESVCFWRSQIRSNITSCYYTWLNQFKPYVFVIFACLVLVVLLSNPKVSCCWHFQGDQWENFHVVAVDCQGERIKETSGS